MTQFAECVNIQSYVVTFVTTARKTFFETPTRFDPNQTVQICELAIYILERKKKRQYKLFSSENYHVLES